VPSPFAELSRLDITLLSNWRRHVSLRVKSGNFVADTRYLLKADVVGRNGDVRFVPKAAIGRSYPITSSVREAASTL